MFRYIYVRYDIPPPKKKKSEIVIIHKSEDIAE